MSFLTMMDKTAVLYHLAIYGESGVTLLQEKWRIAGVTFVCAVQPLDAQETALIDGQYGQSSKMFCEVDVPIREGDRVVLGDSSAFVVRGVQLFNFGRNAHLEVIMTKAAPIDEASAIEDGCEVINAVLLEDGETLLF